MAIDSAPDLGQAAIAPLKELGLKDESQGISAELQEPDMPTDVDGMGEFDAPIPGQSLTNSPDSPMPFEGSPKFTNTDQIVNALFKSMTNEEGIVEVTDLLAQDLPIEDIANIFIFELFRSGMINPDMMMLLIEPVMLILIFVAEYAGVEATLNVDVPDESSEDESAIIASLMNEVEIEDGATIEEAPLSLEQAVIAEGE